MLVSNDYGNFWCISIHPPLAQQSNGGCDCSTVASEENLLELGDVMTFLSVDEEKFLVPSGYHVASDVAPCNQSKHAVWAWGPPSSTAWHMPHRSRGPVRCYMAHFDWPQGTMSARHVVPSRHLKFFRWWEKRDVLYLKYGLRFWFIVGFFSQLDISLSCLFTLVGCLNYLLCMVALVGPIDSYARIVVFLYRLLSLNNAKIACSRIRLAAYMSSNYLFFHTVNCSFCLC